MRNRVMLGVLTTVATASNRHFRVGTGDTTIAGYQHLAKKRSAVLAALFLFRFTQCGRSSSVWPTL